MNADEVVKKLRRAERYCLNEYSKMAGQAAALIESLTAQLAEYDEIAAEYGIDGKTMLTLAKSQLKTAQDNIKLQEQLAASQRRAQDARNELCLKCGRYRESHNGACNGCRWKE